MTVSTSMNTAVGGGGVGRYGGWLGRKQLITMRLLTNPPPPCGSFVKIPRSTATAETTSPATSMIATVLVGGGREMRNSMWWDKLSRIVFWNVKNDDCCK